MSNRFSYKRYQRRVSFLVTSLVFLVFALICKLILYMTGPRLP